MAILQSGMMSIESQSRAPIYGILLLARGGPAARKIVDPDHFTTRCFSRCYDSELCFYDKHNDPMSSRLLNPERYELGTRNSSDSQEAFDLDDADFESQGLTSASYAHKQPKSLLQWLLFQTRPFFKRHRFRYRSTKHTAGRRFSLPRPSTRRICSTLSALLGIVFALLLATAIFRPSYTSPPAHYGALRQRSLQSALHGRANPHNEKVFIAASIYDKGGDLVDGSWGAAVLGLVELLGPENVFLSIYENDSGAEAQAAFERFEDKVQCDHKMVSEERLPVEELPKVTLPDGSHRVKRIAYLAEVRNRALRPLDEPSTMKYDRLLFLNDIVFDPIDAAQLLLSTNLDDNGKASYRAACAVDFINPFKYYDTFATRDLEGYSMGVPFFPWYSSAGGAYSRQDVLDGADAVRVKSCWGGMVAFDAKYFQNTGMTSDLLERTYTISGADTSFDISARSTELPIRFRAEPDLYWDASECCLIHADLSMAGSTKNVTRDFEIYQNPFVRVAYDSRTLWWLRYTRRFERLYTIPHHLINKLVGLPWFNPRRAELEGEQVTERVWTPDASAQPGGSFQEVTRIATRGGYCGMRTLQVIKESPREGEKNWEPIPVPPR